MTEKLFVVNELNGAPLGVFNELDLAIEAGLKSQENKLKHVVLTYINIRIYELNVLVKEWPIPSLAHQAWKKRREVQFGPVMVQIWEQVKTPKTRAKRRTKAA
jgi:hypothetical protein